MTFIECSKQIAKMWHDLPEEERRTYTVRNKAEIVNRIVFIEKWMLLIRIEYSIGSFS